MSFDNSRTPTGDLNVRRVMNPSHADLASVEYSVSNTCIAAAWKKVRSNKGAPGVDNITIEQFPKWGRPKWTIIKNQVETGNYQPLPARRVEIPKESGRIRLLGIPCVLDRVFMQSIARILSDMLNPTFSLHSDGYMPGRSVRQAALQAQACYQQGYIDQIDIDLETFFDTVNHAILMDRIGRKVKDKELMEQLGRFLRAGVVVDGRLQATQLGVPQGSPVSPILSNILLDELDAELEARGHKFVRYADDVAIVVKSNRAGERVLASTRRFLERKLKVKVNKAKRKVSHVKDSSVLGFKIHGKKLTTLDSQVKTFKRKLKRITR